MNIPILPEDTRLLVMCSSKGRPFKLKDLIESVYLNRSKGTELVVYVAEDDPCLEEYKPVLESVPHIIGPNRSMVQVLNFLSTEAYPNIKYYTDLNDDHYVVTPRWDDMLIQILEKSGGWKWVALKSQLGLPTAALVCGNVVRTIGHYYYPYFVQSHVDNTQLEYEKAGLLVWADNVTVEHRHFIFGKSEKDATYARMCTQANFNHGLGVFEHWCREERDKEFQKIFIARESYEKRNKE